MNEKGSLFGKGDCGGVYLTEVSSFVHTHTHTASPRTTKEMREREKLKELGSSTLGKPWM